MQSRIFCDISVRLLNPARAVLRGPVGPAGATLALPDPTGATWMCGGAPGANHATATHARLSRSPHAHVRMHLYISTLVCQGHFCLKLIYGAKICFSFIYCEVCFRLAICPVLDVITTHNAPSGGVGTH